MPDLVEMGVEVLNPVQWNCANMDLEWLKAEFGDRLCFEGAVENQSIIPFGTPEDVRAEVRKTYASSPATGPAICGPCHNISRARRWKNDAGAV